MIEERKERNKKRVCPDSQEKRDVFTCQWAFLCVEKRMLGENAQHHGGKLPATL